MASGSVWGLKLPNKALLASALSGKCSFGIYLTPSEYQCVCLHHRGVESA